MKWQLLKVQYLHVSEAKLNLCYKSVQEEKGATETNHASLAVWCHRSFYTSVVLLTCSSESVRSQERQMKHKGCHRCSGVPALTVAGYSSQWVCMQFTLPERA